MIIVLIIGAAELIYGLLTFLNVTIPYSVKATLGENERRAWGRRSGTVKMLWGGAIVLFSLFVIFYEQSALRYIFEVLAASCVVAAIYATVKVRK